jgi:predicted dehydrogenase
MGVAPYRVLMVGCGQIAGLFDKPSRDCAVLTHAQAYSRDGRFTISACVDPDAERLANFMQTWNVRDGFADIGGAFADGRAYDVMSLCTSTNSHATVLSNVASRPVRAIFAEKPLLAAPCETGAVEPFREAGAPAVMVNYTRRWDPEIEALRALIASGEAGPCRSVTVLYSKGVRNNASHAVQLLTYLLDLDPKSLTIDAVGRWKRDHAADDPTVDALLATDAGTPMHLIGLDARDFALFEIILVFSGRIVEIRDGGWTIRTRLAAPSKRFPNYTEVSESDERSGGYGKALPRALDNIVDCLEGRGRPACGVDEALAVETFCQSLIDLALARPDKVIRT